MATLYKNNAYSTLSAGITDSATSITVQSGHGDRFPQVTAPDIAYITLEDSSGNREIVKVTARSGGSDTMTIVRAQESTSARAFSSADVVEQRVTAGELAGFAVNGAVTGTGITMATGKLLGRSTASTGAIEEITVSTGLTLSGGSLTASAGFTLATPQDAGTGSPTSVSFTGIPAGTKIIAVSGVGVSTNGSSEVIIQLGDSGGAEDSGYTGRVGGGSGYTLGSYKGVIMSSGPTSSSVLEWLAIFVLVNSTTNTWSFQGSSAPASTPIHFAGNKSLTGTLESVRITTQNGTDTFDAGTINIAYM